MGEIADRPVSHGVIRSRPDVTSMVMTMQMTVATARMTMLAVDGPRQAMKIINNSRCEYDFRFNGVIDMKACGALLSSARN